MFALELVHDSHTKQPAPDLAAQTTVNAHERGLVLLSCCLYGNVLRSLVPLVASDGDLERGLEILEDWISAAAA